MNTTGKFLIGPKDPEFSAVMKLDQAQFPKPWSETDWLDLNWDHHFLYAAPNVFALFARVPGDDTTHLLKICVDESLRGTGLAQEFWQKCLSDLKKQGVNSIYLEVEFPNERAIGFYQKSGFKTLRRIKAYYSDGTDALTMQMTL